MGARRVRLNHTALGLVLAGAVAVTGAGSAITAQHRLHSEQDRARHQAQQSLNQTLAFRIGRLATRAHQYAAELGQRNGHNPSSLLAGAPTTDFNSVSLTAPALPLRLGNGAPLPAASDLQSAAVIARDGAAPVAVVTQSASGGNLAVVWPLYDGPVPPDTLTRRTESAGWVVGSVSVRDLVAPIVAAAHGFGATATIDVTSAGPAPVTQTLLSGLSARVTAVPDPSRLGVLLLVVVTLLAVLAIVGLAIDSRRRGRRLSERQRLLDEHAGLASTIGTTIQESLEIGVVLPAVLSQLSDRLQLSWIRIVLGPAATGVELLAIGRPPQRLPVQRTSPDLEQPPAGQLVRLPLRRINRTLGHLELVPMAGLDADQMTTLRQCADLLAGALHNAELYEREQESVRRLRDLDALKDDFLGTVSHELRTPLSVIGGTVGLLTKSWDRLPEDGRRTTVARLQPHVMSLTHLVNDLLDFISDRRSTTSASPTMVPLDQRISDLAEGFRPLVHDHTLSVVAPEPVEAWTDPRAVERIFGNLIGNAGKYSPPGTTIRLMVCTEGNLAVVSVADEGPGIQPEDRERIFERFYRGDSDAARSTRGTGIGLAVALSWMDAVGARLDVHTGVGRGTTMTMRFPVSEDTVVDGAGTVTWHSLDPAEGELVR